MRVLMMIAAIVFLGGCVQTRELQMAQNVVRLETEGRGRIGAQAVDGAIMKRAAEATLQRGYTHFRLDGANMNSRSEIIGFSAGFNSISADRMRVTNVGATVTMYKANEPGARGALDAEEVLASLPK